MKEKLLTSGEAGRAANLSAETIRLYEREGKLKAIKTAGGMRLFRESDIAELVQKRKTASKQ
jgi:DNA-binding transcriptional MerR regulator